MKLVMRSMRYWADMTKPTPPTMPTPAVAAMWVGRNPATNIITAHRPPMMAVVPKSGWPKMRAQGTAGISAAPKMTRRSPMWARYRSKKWARQTNTAILANSDGWRFTEPNPIQRAAPFARY